MSTVGTTPPHHTAWRLQFGLSTLLGTIVLCAVLFVLIRWALRPAPPHRFMIVRSHLQQIASALAYYYEAHGSLPYSERGQEYALYQLRGFIADVSCFDSPDPTGSDRAFWDDDQQCVRNSFVEYLNEPDCKPNWLRVLLVTRPGVMERGAILGFGDGAQRYFDLPDGPTSGLLGSWSTIDDFLVADVQLFDDWCKTHSLSGPWSMTSTGQKLVSATAKDITIEYKYHLNKLEQCVVTTEKGVIKENVRTDDLGRIVGLTREPDDWERLVPDPVSADRGTITDLKREEP